MSRFTHHLFVCINHRDPSDPRGCCASRGAEDLSEVAKAEIHRLSLKGKVRVNKAGCLDACAHGPVCVVYPEGRWYSPKTADEMRAIISTFTGEGGDLALARALEIPTFRRDA